MNLSTFVDNAQTMLDGVAQSQFGTLAGALEGTIMAAATLAIVFLFINGLLQFRPVPIGDAMLLVVKLILITQFARVWGSFDQIAGAVRGGMDWIAAQMMLGGAESAATLAAAFDSRLAEFSTATNTALANLSWFTGGVMSVFLMVLIAIVTLAAGLMMVFSAMMITISLGLAPVFLTLSMFRTTNDYFYKWLQTTLAYALYPVILAAILSTTLQFAGLFVEGGSSSSMGTVSDFIPFVVVLLMLLASVAVIPMIVGNFSGAIGAVTPLAAAAITSRYAGQTARAAMAPVAAGKAAYQKIRGGNEADMSVRERTAQTVRQQLAIADRYSKAKAS